MRDGIFFRNSYKFKNNLYNFFKRYRVAIILLSCFFILGLFVGILTASKYSGSLELDNIPDKNLVDVICGDKGSFGLFFAYLIPLFICLTLIVFFNFNYFCAIINIVYIVIRGYSFGFTIFGIIGLYSLAGIINVVFIIIPFWIIINFIIILISAISITKIRIIKHYGRYCNCNYNPRNLIILLIVLMLAILFLFCMLTPIIKITIIVN